MVEKQNSNNKSKNNIDKCFQYAVTVALNYKQMENHPERISENKSFINQYDWCALHQYALHHTNRIRKILKQIMKKLLLMRCMHHTIVKK